MLNSSDLLALETFNKENVFICSSFWSKNVLHPVTRYKKSHIYVHNFSVSFFSRLLTFTSMLFLDLFNPCIKSRGTMSFRMWFLSILPLSCLQQHKEHQSVKWKYHDPERLPYGGLCNGSPLQPAEIPWFSGLHLRVLPLTCGC